MCHQPARQSQSRQQSHRDMRKPPKECADAEHAPRVLSQQRHPQRWFHKEEISEHIMVSIRQDWASRGHWTTALEPAVHRDSWVRECWKLSQVRQPWEPRLHTRMACHILGTTITRSHTTPNALHKHHPRPQLRWRYENETKALLLCQAELYHGSSDASHCFGSLAALCDMTSDLPLHMLSLGLSCTTTGA